MTIFGPVWEELELEHVEVFLDSAPPEPLLWEAKGDTNAGSSPAGL